MAKFGERYNVLVVGAGGIGYELLKNLAYSGFKKISVIDVDTIELRNLNRQFLFRKVHIGKFKCGVACESIKKFRNDVELTPYHRSIFSFYFDSDFFQKFEIVFNALDNMAARRHVNRMCVNISKPIIESGTSGYLGQVEPLIYFKANRKTPQALCFECSPRVNDKRTFPTCTIRNTPSEPVHCVVWAKFLFNQLFGEPDPENEDISPDFNDPDAKLETRPGGLHSMARERNLPYTSTISLSLWSRVTYGMSEALLTFEESLLLLLFNKDIKALLSMDSLWKNRPDRKEPTPLEERTIKAAESYSELDSEGGTEVPRDQRKMPLLGWIQIFISSCVNLRKKADVEDVLCYGKRKPLSWDKDSKDEMEFIAAASIIRALLFHVPGAENLTLFAKSLAGNIIPAIATTNAIIAGAMVLQARNVLEGRADSIRTVFLHRQPAGFGRFLTTCRPERPNPKCLVCSDGPTQEIRLYCSPMELKLVQLKDEILIKHLGMIAPDVQIEGTGSIIISSDGDETKDIEQKTLFDFKIKGDGFHRLCCDDFRQSMTFFLRIFRKEPCREEATWRIEGNCGSLKADEPEKPESLKKIDCNFYIQILLLM
nr:SUMO activating enzyme subunit 2 [Hymenolepis microstoma]